MKKLSKDSYFRAKEFIITNGRKLEQSLGKES